MADLKGTKITWIGHGTVLITTSEGKRIVVDPWLEGNPTCPDEYKTLSDIDLVLITHGHFDHVSSVIDVVKSNNCPAFAIPEVAAWFNAQGVQFQEMNKGGTVEAAGVAFTMTNATHSGGITTPDGIVYGGEPAGYFLRLPGGLRLYISGDTDVFSDMVIYRELYQPDVAVLCIGDHYTMGPRGAAYAAKLLGVKTVLPVHFGTFPVLTGTPAEVAKLVGEDIEVIDWSPGDEVV